MKKSSKNSEINEISFNDSYKQTIMRFQNDISMTIKEAMKDVSTLEGLNTSNRSIRKLINLDFEEKMKEKSRILEKSRISLEKRRNSLEKTREMIEMPKSNERTDFLRNFIKKTPKYKVYHQEKMKKELINSISSWQNRDLKKKSISFSTKNSKLKLLPLKSSDKQYFDRNLLEKPSQILGVLTLHNNEEGPYRKRIENLRVYDSKKTHFIFENILEEGS